MQFLLYYLSNGHLWEVKNESGFSHLQGVVAYERFHILWLDWEIFGILENRSQRRVVAYVTR